MGKQTPASQIAAHKFEVRDGVVYMDGQAISRIDEPTKKEENYLISWHGYDHENNRTVAVSIGYDGSLFVDGKAIATRINPEEGPGSKEEKS
jgi:hypothetical protein